MISSSNSSSFFGGSRKNKSTPNRNFRPSQVPPPVSLFTAPKRARRSAPDPADENQQYQPGMMLHDRPPVPTTVSSDSELEGNEEEVYNFPTLSDKQPASTTVSEGHSEINSLKTMLQQAIILLKQEATEAKQVSFEQKLTEFEQKV